MSAGLLIADIGGSGSRWAWCANDAAEPRYFDDLPGFNPATGDGLALVQALRASLIDEAGVRPAHIDVYGAGCGTVERAQRMRDALAGVWPEARIDVRTDLLGAARGLYGRSPGLVLILGTGMNVGYYDGATLECPLPSMGFILGDEASGADIGKHLLSDLFHGRIPVELAEQLFPTRPSLDEVVRRVYREPGAQRYLAGFTARLDGALQEPYVRKLVLARATALAELIVPVFPEEQRRSVRATGSVAHAFQELMKEAFAAWNITLDRVERGPLPGLVRYHRSQP